MTTRTRVLLVDDSADIRELYRRVIAMQPDMECVETLESTVGLEDALARSAAKVAVIDLVGPGRDAVEAIASAAPAFPACRFIAFSGHDDDATRAEVARAGAWSLVSKNGAPMAVIDEIRRAAAAP